MTRNLLTFLALIAGVIFYPSIALAAGEVTPESNAFAINTVWVLLGAFLVFIMHIGFAMVEAGFTRAKNTVNILTKNVLTISLGGLLFMFTGFAFAFGGDAGGFIGTYGFFLSNLDGMDFGVPTYAFWFFQAVFCATAATIVSGAVAERIKLIAYLIFTVIITAFIYPVVVHWVWNGDGWLATRGFVDFAGSTVVHSVGGWSALVGAYLVGARKGKYDKDGHVRVIPGHSLPLGTLGTLILWFGWFGFNTGSTLSGTAPEVGLIATTTMLAASAGVIATAVYTTIKHGKADLTLILNGALGGLVGITAGTAAVTPVGAIIIGAAAGILLPVSVEFFDRTLKIDDPVGAISVHAVCGVLGTLAVGLFAREGGLFYGGGASLLVTQLIGVIAVLFWTVVTAFISFKVIDAMVGLRVSEEEELEGLDIYEHGTEAYGDFALRVGDFGRLNNVMTTTVNR